MLKIYKKINQLLFTAFLKCNYILTWLVNKILDRPKLSYAAYCKIKLWKDRTLAAQKDIAQTGFEIVDFAKLRSLKTSDTLVIFGSGPSLLDLSESQWDKIKTYDSIGFNFFFVHQFVPTYYHMEVREDYYHFFKDCYKLIKKKYDHVPFMLNYNHLEGNFDKSSFDFINNLMVTTPENYTGASKAEFAEILKYYYQTAKYRERQLLIHPRASLILMISFGVLLMYKRLILVGVDLKSDRYFFEDSRYNSELGMMVTNWKNERKNRYCSKLTQKIHPTADPTVFPEELTIDTIIHLFNQIVLTQLGIEIFITSRNSLLYPTIPHFQL